MICFLSFERLKELKIFVLTVLPQQPQHSIFRSQIHHTSCSRRKDGRYKIHSKIIFSFPKKNHAYLNFEILQQYGFGCR